jgi:hypothetical protein
MPQVVQAEPRRPAARSTAWKRAATFASSNGVPTSEGKTQGLGCRPRIRIVRVRQRQYLVGLTRRGPPRRPSDPPLWPLRRHATVRARWLRGERKCRRPRAGPRERG